MVTAGNLGSIFLESIRDAAMILVNTSDEDCLDRIPEELRCRSQKDRFPRRRSILDSRWKDDRGNHRDTGRAMDEDRDDKTDNSPSHEGNGGLEGGNTDEAYDGYGGQGLHGVAPFPLNIPPPLVLMPVPGAGPLGPFVPAPPEVVMRMLRDQGGPSPYEGNGGPCRRKGRSGSGPILCMPPPFRQDPRRIRKLN